MRVNQTEAFAATLRMSDGQTQPVQPTWQSDNTTVLTFENGGTARGRNNGTATIIGTHQGLTATRLIRVASDYQGAWVGDYVIRRCDDAGDFRDTDFCDREDGFYAGEILEVGLELRQDGTSVTGDARLGGIEGTASGSLDTQGRFAGSGSLTFVADGFPVAFAVNPLSLNAEGDRLTGTFTVTVTAPGLTGQGVFDAELPTVVRTAAGVMPSGGRSETFGNLRELLRAVRQ